MYLMSQQHPFKQSGNDYMPRGDQPFLLWVQNFAERIHQNWSMYGLGKPDAESIWGHYQAYAQILPKSKFPTTRNSGVVAQKDAVKAAARATCRVYAMIIKADKSIDNQAKLDLGLRISDRTPTPIPAPATAPILQISGMFSGEHQITFRDEMTPDSKRRPPGAAQLELYVHVGPSATVDYNKAKFVGAYGRGPILHTFEPAEVNLVATYFAKWRTQRGLVGPWSQPVCMTVACGGPVEQQMSNPAPGSGGTPKHAPGAEGGEDDMKIAA
jgi:hypothetical protein